VLGMGMWANGSTARRAMLAAVVAAAYSVAGATAEMAIDGDMADWMGAEQHRLYPPLGEVRESAARVYAKVAEETYWLRVAPQPGMELYESAIYFNLDEDQATGYNVGRQYGNAPEGYEFYAFFDKQSVKLYEGCSPYQGEECRELLLEFSSSDSGRRLLDLNSTASEFALLEDNSLEFMLPPEIFDGVVTDIEIAVALQSVPPGGTYVDAVSDTSPLYLLNYHSVYADLEEHLEATCEHDDTEVRAAVLFDSVARDTFYNDMAYTQLFVAMQHQVRQAGIPHDRIRAQELTDMSIACKYDVIVIPALSKADQAAWAGLKKSLFLLTQVYGVNVILAGELLTYSNEGKPVAGDPYFAMKTLLGIKNSQPVAYQTSSTTVKIASKEELFWDKQVDEVVMGSKAASSYVSVFEPTETSSFETKTLATQTIVPLASNETVELVLPAIQTTVINENLFGRRSGRIVHFSTTSVMGNRDLVWRAVQFTLRRESPAIMALQLSRFPGGAFTCRNDMDQSQYIKEFKVVGPELLNMALYRWYEDYNFVGSYYVNIGGNVDYGKYTDWDFARRLYANYLGTENEIGSHSYTHPHNINALTATDLEFEFNQAQDVIMRQLDLDRLGTAQPGRPNNLQTTLRLDRYMNRTYFSGGFSGENAGFPGAFGYVTPESDMVYVSPNMQFDFSLQILDYSPEEMVKHWKDEVDALLAFSSSQVFQWPVHDYAILDWDDDNFVIGGAGKYTLEQFDETIEFVAGKNVEFITVMQLNDRIRASEATKYQREVVGPNTVKVQLTLQKPVDETMTLGHHVLKLESPGTETSIVNVGDHYAFSDSRVFLPSEGGTFLVQFGSEAEALEQSTTRIVDIGMRTELVSVAGDGKKLQFTVRGKGDVSVQLADSLLNPNKMEITHDSGKYNVDQESGVVRFKFNDIGEHSISITPKFPDEVQCLASCLTIPGYRKRTGIYPRNNCKRLEPSSKASGVCSCALQRDGAINDDNSIDMAIACKDLFNSKPLVPALDNFFATSTSRERLESACSQMCANEPNCKYWTFEARDSLCNLLTCYGEPSYYRAGNKVVMGLPCPAN